MGAFEEIAVKRRRKRATSSAATILLVLLALVLVMSVATWTWFPNGLAAAQQEAEGAGRIASKNVDEGTCLISWQCYA